MNANIQKLYDIAQKPSRKIIGLMSGTSLDGLDIALCEYTGSGLETKVEVLKFKTEDYSEDLKNEIVSSVGYDPKCAPMQLNEAETAKALGVKASTLSVWRSTGRYDLRYVKTGRLVRYRVSDIAEFIERRTVLHTQ